MKYDWMAQAYASAPTMSSAGQRHRAKYLKHWAKKSKPEDAISMAHIDALKYEERRERVKNWLEQRAIERAKYAVADGEFEDVPPSEWKVGDEVEAVLEGWAFKVGSRRKIKELTTADGIVIENGGAWFRNYFRLRRPKNPAFVNGVIDLSKAAVGSKWKTRDHARVVVSHIDINYCDAVARVLDDAGNPYFVRKDGSNYGTKFIIAPWKD